MQQERKNLISLSFRRRRAGRWPPIFGRGGGWAHVVLGLYIEQESYFVGVCVEELCVCEVASCKYRIFIQYQNIITIYNIKIMINKHLQENSEKLENITNTLSTFHHTHAKHT